MLTSSRFPDVVKIRQDFPVFFQDTSSDSLQHLHTASGIVHLNNAATTHKPARVIEAVSRFYKSGSANVHRSSRLTGIMATESFESGRHMMQQFVNARYAEEIIWTKGATESINLVAHSWGRTHLHAGDEILLMVSEHHANIVPWQEVAKAVGALIHVVPVASNTALDMDVFTKLLNARTRFVGIGHVSNATGRINPVQEMISAAREAGAVVLVDGAQAAPHFPIDVQALDCDFYVISGHKMYGPNGIGVLYGRRELLETMHPWQTGGGMVSSVSFEKGVQFNPLPFRLEAGTPNIASVLGLSEAIRYLQSFDREAIILHETQLLRRLYDGLSSLPGVKVIGEREHRAGVISFVSTDYHHHDLSVLLGNKGIVLRSGHHCAMPLMKALDLKGTLRVSVAMYTSNDDIDYFLTSLQEIMADKENQAGLHSSMVSQVIDKAVSENNATIPLPDNPLLHSLAKKRDWSSRYRNVIRLGETLPTFPAELHQDEYLVSGCESSVWLHAEYDEACQKIRCFADSDSNIMRGLIALLLLFVNDKSPRYIVKAPLITWFEHLGFMEHLSHTRGNGLRAMIERIHHKARQCLIEEDRVS